MKDRRVKLLRREGAVRLRMERPPIPPREITCGRCGVKVVLKGRGTGRTKYCVECRDVVYKENQRKQKKRRELAKRVRSVGVVNVTQLSLTPRQKLVLSYLRDGYTAEETAHRLGRSVFTVKTMVRDAQFRLGARNTTQAVVIAIRRGLLELGDEVK